MTMAAIEPLLSLIRSQFRANRIPCLMYHEVLPDSIDAGLWTVVRESDFDQQLQHLRRHYTPISIEEAIDEYRIHKRWPSGAVLVTFDDGYRGNLENALPVASSRHVPITVFVATKWVQDGGRHWFDKLMVYLLYSGGTRIDLRDHGGEIYSIKKAADTETWWNDVSQVLEKIKQLPEEDRRVFVDQIVTRHEKTFPVNLLAPLTVEELRELDTSPLVTIGAHSHSHEILTGIPREQALQSIVFSRDLLKQWLGSEIKHFAYPNGNFNQETKELLRDLDFTSAVTTEARLWNVDDDFLSLPRIGVGRFDPAGFFRSRVAGLAG